MCKLICGNTATAYNNTNARIGVGDSSTAASASQTDLQAATNKVYVGMNGGYPTSGTSQQMVFQASFDGSTGNFVWNEWTVDNGVTAHLNMNRKVESLGTKVTGTWTLTITITIS